MASRLSLNPLCGSVVWGFPFYYWSSINGSRADFFKSLIKKNDGVIVVIIGVNGMPHDKRWMMDGGDCLFEEKWTLLKLSDLKLNINSNF